jgi:hypothetical protein
VEATLNTPSLGATLRQYLNVDRQRYPWYGKVPEDAICPQCQGLLPMHPTVPQIRQDVRGAKTCECKEEAQRLQEARRVLANLPRHSAYQLPFLTRPGTQGAEDAIRYFVEGKEPTAVLLTGGFGCGKTHLLSKAGQQLFAAGAGVRYEYVPDFLDALRAGSAIDARVSADEVYRRAADAWVLLLDDIGADEHVTPFVRQQMGGDTRAEQVKIVAMTSTDYRREVEVPARPSQTDTQRS